MPPDDPLTARIIQLHTEGLGRDKIGLLVYLSASAVAYRLQQAGVVNVNRRGNALSEDDVQKLKSLKMDGLSIRKIAEQAEVSINTVRKYAKGREQSETEDYR